MSDQEYADLQVDDSELFDPESPATKRPRRSTAARTKSTPRAKGKNKKVEAESEEEGCDFEAEDADSDYNPGEDDPPSPKAPKSLTKKRARPSSGRAPTPRGRGRGKGGKKSSQYAGSEAGSTDVDEEEEDFEIQEGEDDAEDIFADDTPAAKDKIYEFETESNVGAPPSKRRYVPIKPVQKSASSKTAPVATSTWGNNIYSALATSLKSRQDLDNYSSFLRSPYLNIALDKFLIDYCKPSAQHTSLFFGPSASLQALLSRVSNPDTVVDLLTYFMSLDVKKTAYKPSLLVPLVHQTVLPIDSYEIINSKLSLLSKSLGYDTNIAPGYYLDSHNMYCKAKQFTSFSTHQLVTLYSTLPMAGHTDLVTNVMLPAAVYNQFVNYVSVSRDSVIEYAENLDTTSPTPDCLGRVVMLTDSAGKVLGLSILDTVDKASSIPNTRERMPFNLNSESGTNVDSKKLKSPVSSRKKSPQQAAKECLEDTLDWVCAVTDGSGKTADKSQIKELDGVHVLDVIILTSNAKPQVLLAVGIRSTAEPPLPADLDIGSLVICSLANDEQIFLANQGVTPNLPMPPKGRFLLDSGSYFRERSSLVIPDALYSNVRRMAITEVISASGAVAGLGIAAVPMNKETDVKWLILDSVTNVPLCMAVQLPFSFSMQNLHDPPRVRENGKATISELANYSEDQIQLMEGRFGATSNTEYRVAVINGLICALKVDFESSVIERVIELVPASQENVHPTERDAIYACQAFTAEPRSVSTCLRVSNKDTGQASFLPAVFYSNPDSSSISKIVAGYCDLLADVLHFIPMKLSIYDIALRLALRDTPKILARQHRLTALSEAEQHKLEHPDEADKEIPPVPEKWKVCTICLREFHSTIGLYHHELRHINIGRYQCSGHDAIFLSEESYKRHMLKEHSKTREEENVEEPEEEKEADWISDSVLKLFEPPSKLGEVKVLAPQCKICGDYFPTADVITQHLDVCTGESIGKTELLFAVKKEEDSEDRVKRECFTCGICGQQQESKSQLKTHFVEAHLTCVVCLQAQRSLEELSYHYGGHLAKADPALLVPPADGNVDETDLGARLRSIQTCDVCPNYHATGTNFQYHKALEHGLERDVSNLADFQFVVPSTDTDEKQQRRRIKMMQCKFCELEVPVSGSRYVEHLSQVHNVDVDMFQICRICAEVFPSESALSSHIAAEHPLNVFSMAGIQSVYSCPKCVFYSFYRGMMNHCREVHKDLHPEIYECTHCGSRFADRYEYRRHSETHTDGYNFQCPDCTRSFRLRMSLMIHMKNHHSGNDEQGPKACEFCGLVYPSGRLLKQHIDRTHNKELKLECSECGRRFRLETDLRRHIKEMHSGAVKCEVCNKICANLRSYSLHRNKHFKMRVFQCTECNATFKSKASMKRHIRVDHLNLGPERFECQICGKIVCQIGMHMLTHKGTRFVCEYCGKGFTKSAYYNEHVRIHKGELPYECYICKKRFNKKSNLNVHLRFHEKNRDAEGNYIELRTRGRYSVMFGDAALTPEQRQARQSALNFAIMPTEHVSVGPEEPGAFNVGGPAHAAEEACNKVMEGVIASAGPLRRADVVASARFDEMLSQEKLANGSSSLKTVTSVKVINGSNITSIKTSPSGAHYDFDDE
ncbi:hypothetical protein Ciccas_006470 [Cichlidogyrus casuarinus]|uniref:C2H2-type domain-containing protein n=1 Tax=Cichlidogyrus casuarinus TaxID=1844966 RepID=A0ABD2Q5U5_9PLAT